MGAFIDLTGQKFGRLTVISRSEKIQNKKVYWDCVCDCGNTTIAVASELRTGHTKSCGCIVIEIAKQRRDYDPRLATKKLGFQVASYNRIFKLYQRNATKVKRGFEITLNQFIDIVKRNCYYCDAIPSNVMGVSKNKISNGIVLYNGIDRLDSTKGYVEGNVVPCCKDCNFMKKNMPEGEFINKIIEIYNHSVVKKPESIRSTHNLCGML